MASQDISEREIIEKHSAQFVREGEVVNEEDVRPEDAIPDLPENQAAREFLKTAPTNGLYMPLGKEVKVMQCWRCKAYGHRYVNDLSSALYAARCLTYHLLVVLVVLAGRETESVQCVTPETNTSKLFAMRLRTQWACLWNRRLKPGKRNMTGWST